MITHYQGARSLLQAFLLLAICCWSSTSYAQTKINPNQIASGSVSANVTWLGTNTFKNLNNIQLADQFSGSDCGAKINAALFALSGPGEVWVNQNCGTSWTTAVTLGTNQVLRFIQGGTYSTSAIITLGRGAEILGTSEGEGITSCGGANSLPAVVTLQMANSANLAELIDITGGNAVIHGIALNGNASNNASAGPNIYVNGALRVTIEHVVTSNSVSHGISMYSSGTSNASGSGKLFRVMSCQNGGDGVFSQGTADWYVSNSEFESNTSNGIELSDSPTWRVEHNDLGYNGGQGIYVYGSGTGLGANGEIIVGNQFASAKNDIDISGWGQSSSVQVSRMNVIVGNEFYGCSLRRDATYDGIYIQDSGDNVVGPNTFQIIASHRLNSLVHINQTTSSREDGDSLIGNTRMANGAEVAVGYINNNAPYTYEVANADGVLYAKSTAGISGGQLYIYESGSCTMSSGACSAHPLTKTYSTAPRCFGSWTGSGTLTGILKFPSTTSTVTPASSVGSDTAVVNWECHAASSSF